MAETNYTAKDLAAEFEITPADLRKHLRALKIEKPDGGWKWAKKTDKGLVEIRKQVKQRLKDLASAPAKAEKKAPKAEKEKAPKAKKEKAPKAEKKAPAKKKAPKVKKPAKKGESAGE